jgi:hypothetical protein
MRFWRRLADVIRRRRLIDEMNEELRFHRERLVEERRADGRNGPDAEYDAIRRMGNTTLVAEEARSMWSVNWFEHLLQDLRFGWRALRRSPGFTAVATLTLALGIGANTAIFSVVRGVLLKPLPHHEGDRLVYLRHSMDGPGGASIAFSVPEVRDFRAGAPSLAGIAEFSQWTLTFQDTEGAVRLPAGLVTGNYFEVMGLSAVLGRLTEPTDDGPGVPPVMVLTHDGWRKRVGGDSSIVGKQLRMDGKLVTVIGVLEPAPFFPGNADALFNMVVSDHHISAFMVEGRTHRMTEMVARLAPGATLAQARREVL